MIVVEAIASILIIIGGLFLLVGSLGLAILPDMMRRLHAPTKASTLGIGAILVGSMVYFMGLRGELAIHEILITLFVFITAPVSGMMIAKAHMLRDRGVRADLPPTGTTSGWATLDPGKLTATRLPPAASRD
ncbi:MAG: Na+/H+ antiporter subunit G [Beijerinckiaceae bacterium]|nr:Na+/H+ antiporter subunit G [Beijerinckiaceae bacterium]